jgi:hypothetical protein
MRDSEQGRNRRGFDYQLLPEAPKTTSFASPARPTTGVDALGALRRNRAHTIRGM